MADSVVDRAMIWLAGLPGGILVIVIVYRIVERRRATA